MNSCVDVGDVPEILAQQHFLGHILTEFHHLFANITEKGIS